MGMFRAPDRDTVFLLPPSVDEWLPKDHLARFVVDAVGALDLTMVEGEYAGCGSKPYHPRMLLSLLFYGYATGIFSSRRLEQATYESIPMRFVCGNLNPDHDTIATFRKRFMPHLEGAFNEVLLMAHEMGLLRIGKVSVDGSKVQANASKHKALSWERANLLEKQIEEEARRLLRMAEEADAQEVDDQLDLPAELAHRETRLKKIREAKAEIERRARERYETEKREHEEKLARRAAATRGCGKAPKPPEEGPQAKDQVNLTDEQSRVMLSRGGFVQAYNGQLAVDTENGFILSCHVTNAPVDVHQLAPAIERLKKLPPELGCVEAVLADYGYFSKDNVTRCHEEGITPYVACSRERHHPTLEERLGPQKVEPPPEEEENPVDAMKRRLKTREGRAVYAKRKSTVEPRFGIIKHVLGFRQFLLRGLENVHGEWQMVCIAANLKRMHALKA